MSLDKSLCPCEFWHIPLGAPIPGESWPCQGWAQGLRRRAEGGSSPTWAWLQGQGHSRVVDNLQALSFLEGQVCFGPGLIVVESHEGGDSTCDREHSGRALPPALPRHGTGCPSPFSPTTLPPTDKTQICSPSSSESLKSRRPPSSQEEAGTKPTRTQPRPSPPHRAPAHTDQPVPQHAVAR